MLQIGSTVLPHGLMLSPLAGFTDHAMRTVCYECGAEYSVTEMVSAKAVCYGDRKTPLLARVYGSDGPTAIQLFGREPKYMAEAAKRLYESCGAWGVYPAAFDINMGCPMPKIVNNGEGSALMREPALVEKLVAALAAATPLPVTVKIRTGWDAEHINAPEVARAAEAGGAAAICIHGRTRVQMYSGDVDLSAIAAVKRAVSVPVIGNGDVTDAASALHLIAETGCDGIAIGRGAVGDPFLFARIAAALAGEDFVEPVGEEYCAAALRQLSLRIEEKGEENGVLESRKQMASFLHGFPHAASLRAAIYTAKTADEMEEYLSVLRD